MRAKKVSIMLDGLSGERSMRSWISQTIKVRVRGPRWLVTASLLALLLLTVYHWHSLHSQGAHSDSADTRARHRATPVGDSLNTRLDLLSQAAMFRAERTRGRTEEVQASGSDRGDAGIQSALDDRSQSDGRDDAESDDRRDDVEPAPAVPEIKVVKMTPAQRASLDAIMDDMSATKRNLMYSVFERYVLPGSPEVLQWKSKGHDRQDRPGYFRPGNWDWTMTKVGEYDPDLFSPPPGELPKQRFPQAIMIGSGHCGTRAMLDFLQMHPNIVVAHSEIHFFDEFFHKGMDWYRSQMPYSFSNQLTLEKSPAYVMVPQAAKEVYAMDKHVKLLMVVKDPVVTLMSAFSRQVSVPGSASGPIRYTFLKEENGTRTVNGALYSVARGLYSVHLKNWLRYFPLSQLHILDGGALVKDPIGQTQAVERFLQVPPRLTEDNFFFNQTKGFYCLKPFTMREPKCLGKNKGRPHVTLPPDVKKLLYDFYRPYNQELFRLIGKSFDWEPKDKV